MADAAMIAQVVMRGADGRSILDIEGPLTAAAPDRTAGDLPEARVEEIRGRLEALGFAVEAGDAAALSVTGPAALFAELFGLEPGMTEAPRIPEDLAPFLAAVMVPPPPEFFP
jgi:hypothetical protein